MAAIRSIEEWIASEIMLTDPLISPMANFIIISKVLDNIESRAILTLAFIEVSRVFGKGSNLVRKYSEDKAKSKVTSVIFSQSFLEPKYILALKT
jgi:hypothetical protein